MLIEMCRLILSSEFKTTIMKKVLLTITTIILFITTAKAQDGINVGVFGGLPVGEGDIYGMTIGLDTGYLFKIGKNFNLGGMTGVANIFGKTFEGYSDTTLDDEKTEAFQYIPIAAAARLNFSRLTAGLDIGYAVVLDEYNDGALYIRPLLGYNITEMIQINASPRFLVFGSSGAGQLDYDGEDFYYDGYDFTFIILSVGATFSF